MYIPRVNKEERIPVLHKLEEDQPFASLIPWDHPACSPRIFLWSLPTEWRHGRQLRGHISRAKYAMADYTPSVEALAISPARSITHAELVPEKRTGKVVAYVELCGRACLWVPEDHRGCRMVDGPSCEPDQYSRGWFDCSLEG